MKRVAALILLVLAGCGTPSAGQATASPSSSTPSASASASPSPTATVAPAVAVLDWDQGFTGYTLRLVSAGARVLASVHATWTYGGKCGPVEAGILTPPPVSASDSRAYYLDAGGIKWLKEDGTTGVAFAGIAARANTAIGFAVAPDDSAFALNTIDYTATPLTQHLTVTPVGATALGPEIYSARSPASAPSSAVWPAGWRGGNLVLAYHVGTCTQGGGPGLGDPTSYHVVNPTTATRLATIGQDNAGGCPLSAHPTPAGIPCAGYYGGATEVLDWTGAHRATFSASFPGSLSPNGTEYVGTVGTLDQTSQTNLTLIHADGTATPLPGPVGDVMWIDDAHFLVEPNNTGTGSAQPQVFSVSPLQAVPVSAPGTPVARIPGSLGG